MRLRGSFLAWVIVLVGLCVASACFGPGHPSGAYGLSTHGSASNFGRSMGNTAARGAANSVNYSVLRTIAVGSYPEGVYYDSSNGQIYTANRDSDNISVVNATSFRLVGTVYVGQPVHMFAMDSVTGQLVVGSDSTPFLTTLDPFNDSIQSIDFTGYSMTQGVQFDPTTGQLFVVDATDAELLTVNSSTYSVTTVTDLTAYPGGGDGFAIDTTSHVIYFPDRGTISAQLIWERNGTTFADVSLPSSYGPTASFFDEANGLVYFMMGGLVASPGDQTLVMNPANNDVVTSLTVQPWPAWSAYDPVRHLIYFTGGASNDVSVVNDTTDTVVGTISLPAGSAPGGIAVDPTTGDVFVAATGLNELVEVGIASCASCLPVTFTETGLSPGTNWSVTVHGSLESARSSTILFWLPNGSYTFAVGSVPGYACAPTTGPVTVVGSPVSVPVTCVKLFDGEYAVTFVETGLVPGTPWLVIVGDQASTVAGSSIIFAEPNGSYPFMVPGVFGYDMSPASGLVNVSDDFPQVAVVFQPIPAGDQLVSFFESGLPPGVQWTVDVNGSLQSSAGTVMVFAMPAGEYSFSVSPITDYRASPTNGSFEVRSANLTVSIEFGPASVSAPTCACSSDWVWVVVPVVVALAVVGAVVLTFSRFARHPRP